MSNAPPPSQLCLLSDLPLREVGDKVRFLGCVTSYSTDSATLALEHQHQQPQDSLAVRALVDVRLVLGRLGSDQTRIGEWVNVIGYITAVAPLPLPTAASNGSDRGHVNISTVRAQALLVWSAGPLDVQRYNSSVAVLESEQSSPSGDDVASDALLHTAGR
ncbi:CST complex subunit Ten1 [Lasiosphaeria ovina]|uniref:CST complex subunit Ten1 n=1 Tax=Lasiosphaeria ovina TaxID=92902 RepID=A0AAE0KB59_9PEZI|nr:CST complex subunit Ten1 [Lasiosphaeria ovina]